MMFVRYLVFRSGICYFRLDSLLFESTVWVSLATSAKFEQSTTSRLVCVLYVSHLGLPANPYPCATLQYTIVEESPAIFV